MKGDQVKGRNQSKINLRKQGNNEGHIKEKVQILEPN